MNPDKHFQFARLFYQHTQALDEKINIGMLFYFPDAGKLIFKHPENLNRIKMLYGNSFSDNIADHYLTAFDKRANDLTEGIEKIGATHPFDYIITEYFLRPDASSLQFAEIKTGVLYAAPEQIAKDFFEMDFKHWKIAPPMNNLQKLGRLFQFFASCDHNHNNNELKFEACDNGILVEIGFDDGKLDMLNINFDYKFSSDDFSIGFIDNWKLHAFTYDFEKLDELLTKIFTEVIKTDMETLSTDMNKNSN